MELTIEKHPYGVAEIRLQGRLDMVGVGAIELRFGATTGANRAVLIDLSGVDFVTSLGIRLLLQGAKTVRANGGKLALLQPNDLIRNVLETAGIGSMIPIFRDREAAVAAITA